MDDNDAHPTTIRVAAKTAMPDLFRTIRDDLVPLFAKLRVEAIYLYRIHLLRILRDHQLIVGFKMSVPILFTKQQPL